MQAVRLLAVLVFAAVAIAACSGNPDACGSGGTKVCLPDGKTCMCAPSCADQYACMNFEICDGNGSCETCDRIVAAGDGMHADYACACVSNLCVPRTWPTGSTLSIESPDGGASASGGDATPAEASTPDGPVFDTGFGGGG